MENIQKQNKILKVIIFILLLLLLGISIFCINYLKSKENDNQTTEEYKNIEDFVTIEDYNISNETLKKVNFKNLDSTLIKKFTDKQDNNIKDIEKIINSTNKDPETKEQFKDTHILESNVWAQINANILTIYQEYKVSVENTYTYLNTININLKNKKVLSNEDILKLANTNFLNLATAYYNKEIEDPTIEYIYKKNPNKECNEVISKKELIEQKDIYINLIKDNLDSVIYSYIKDNKIHYKYAEAFVKLLYQNLCIGSGFSYTDVELT